MVEVMVVGVIDSPVSIVSVGYSGGRSLWCSWYHCFIISIPCSISMLEYIDWASAVMKYVSAGTLSIFLSRRSSSQLSRRYLGQRCTTRCIWVSSHLGRISSSLPDWFLFCSVSLMVSLLSGVCAFFC